MGLHYSMHFPSQPGLQNSKIRDCNELYENDRSTERNSKEIFRENDLQSNLNANKLISRNFFAEVGTILI